MNKEEEEEEEGYKLSLVLGDIIEVIAPANSEIHEMTCIIDYINTTKLIVINVSSARKFQLNLTENGSFTDESITGINLLNRADEQGYARQNNLLVGTWINIHFGGDFPAIITGEITNLDEDMIELTTYPELDVIYIDFEYKGIPEHIPIEKITIRQKPDSLRKVSSLSLVKENLDEQSLATMEYTDEGESIINIPETAEEDENIRETLHNLYNDSNEIVFHEFLEPLYQYVEVPENEKRYGLENQVDDLMDELLSTIPNSQRTKRVIDNIHLLIDRFKQLRENFSKFDENDNIIDFKTFGANYKPLIERIQKLDMRLHWLVPVVSMRKKIYGIDENLEIDDVISEKQGIELEQINSIQTSYYSSKSSNRTLDYSTLNRRIANLMLPIDSPLDLENKLVTKQVLCNIDSIVDNLNDFQSTIHNASGIAKRRFITQRYNLGITKMEQRIMKNGKKKFSCVPMTDNNNITIKSFLMLPASVMRYSKVELSNTNIMEKSALSQVPFLLYKLLHKKVDIIPNIIDNLEKELDYEQMEKDRKQEFLSGLNEFILSDDMNATTMNATTSEKYEKFLEVILPKTKLLFRVVRKYVKDKLSFIDVVQSLEPFAINTSDITYRQYMEIRYFIKQRILQLKSEFSAKSSEFNLLRTKNYNVPDTKMKSIQQILSEDSNYMNMFLQAYKLVLNESDKLKKSSQEVIATMLHQDKSNLYTSLLSLLMISLVTPEGLLYSLNEELEINEMTDIEKIKPTDCSLRYLAKKYSSITELQKDNNIDTVYYDKDYDDTPYHILKKYKDKQKEMNPEDFIHFFAENLIQKHDCPTEIANFLAKTIIANKKIVQDGDYAVLELKPKLLSSIDKNALTKGEQKSADVEAEIRKKVEYYRRLKTNWIHDDTIGSETFYDTNTIFCNVSDKCLKNQENNMCEPIKDSERRIKEMMKKNLKNEFDSRYETNVEELKTTLTQHLDKFIKMIRNLRKINYIKEYKQNNFSYELGKFANTVENIQSPHIRVRDLILGQDDFSKKQSDIIRFFETYCREPLVDALDENANWKYCIDTNTKLLPGFIYELAVEFINNGDYQNKQNELCHRIGKLSDDGDSFVDKHSGFVIRKIDFSTEEGFDEAGHRITTHAILEQDLGAVVLEAIGKKDKRIFETQLSESIYNVYTTIASNIDIKVEGVDDFVLRVSNELIEKTVKTQENYEKQSEKLEKEKGKKRASYTKYKNELTVIIIACTLFISIQTAMPAFQTKKTFPGCVRSFSGFPLNGIEDITGIQYVACVLSKVKSSIEPWKSIHNNKEHLTKQMKDYIENVIMKRNDIEQLYLLKREHLLLNPDIFIHQEHSIQKWTHYLPPLLEYTVAHSTKSISSEFKKDFMEVLRQGNKDQHQLFNVVKSKAALFGYVLIEQIKQIITSKTLLLKTSSQIPFIENACCNENMDLTNPIQYFISEDDDIKNTIRVVSHLSNMIQDIKLLSRASLLYHLPFTGIIYPSIPAGHLDENIFAAFIHYCNFDRNLPLPIEYTDVCSEKPANYKSYWSMSEKVEFLKKNGKGYTVGHLNQLMRLVNQQNLITVHQPVPFTKVDVIKDIVENLDRTDSTVIQGNMREQLRSVLDAFNPKSMKDITSDELDNLKEYLYVTNDSLYKTIIDFIDKYGELSRLKFNKMNTFLTTLTMWNTNEKNIPSNNRYNDEELYSVTQFVQNAVQSLTKTYPNILLHLPNHTPSLKHWGLTQADTRKVYSIVEKHYESIEKFKMDTVVNRLLHEISAQLIELNLFTQNIPIITPIIKNSIVFHSLFDKPTIFALLQYCFYSALYEYIIATDNPDLLTIDIENNKAMRRQKKADIIIDSFRAESIDLGEEYLEEEENLEEVQINLGDKQELKKRVCQLLLSFLEIEETNKRCVNFSYSEISSFVRRGRDKEKYSIIKYFRDMDAGQRKVEDNLKHYKLGKWNVGMQKGLIQYDAETNNREQNELIVQLMQDVEEGEMNIFNELAMDVYDVAKPNLEEVEEDEDDYGDEDNDFYDRGNMEIDHNLGEDYMDGNYYEEDIEEE